MQSRENYTELLWFFEGFTSYFDDLFIVRSGLIDSARYLKLLATTIAAIQASPGRAVQSVAGIGREMQEQRRLQELATRVLAGLHVLRTAFGGAAPLAGVDPLQSAAASLQAGADQDEALVPRLRESEQAARGDPYVGRGEFEANRAAMRKLLDALAAAPAAAAVSIDRRAEAAAGHLHHARIAIGAARGTRTQLDLVAHRALHARRPSGRAPLQCGGAIQRNNKALEQCTCVPVRSRLGRDAGHANRHAASVPLNVHRL